MDQIDEERIKELKSILFDIHRVCTGEEVVNVDEFIQFLTQNKPDGTYGDYLFDSY